MSNNKNIHHMVNIAKNVLNKTLPEGFEYKIMMYPPDDLDLSSNNIGGIVVTKETFYDDESRIAHGDKDIVYIFIGNIIDGNCNSWNKFPVDKCVERTCYHESRHAQQICALRKVEDKLKFPTLSDTMINYYDGKYEAFANPFEMDANSYAYSNSKLSNYTYRLTIEEFANAIVTNDIAHERAIIISKTVSPEKEAEKYKEETYGIRP